MLCQATKYWWCIPIMPISPHSPRTFSIVKCICYSSHPFLLQQIIKGECLFSASTRDSHYCHCWANTLLFQDCNIATWGKTVISHSVQTHPQERYSNPSGTMLSSPTGHSCMHTQYNSFSQTLSIILISMCCWWCCVCLAMQFVSHFALHRQLSIKILCIWDLPPGSESKASESDHQAANGFEGKKIGPPYTTAQAPAKHFSE